MSLTVMTTLSPGLTTWFKGRGGDGVHQGVLVGFFQVLGRRHIVTLKFIQKLFFRDAEGHVAFAIGKGEITLAHGFSSLFWAITAGWALRALAGIAWRRRERQASML
jgi:Na+-driven multidrug efflux pump